MSTERRSSFLILGACLIWATDLLVRYPITLKLSYIHIVFLESLLGLLFVSPWLIKHGRHELKKFSKLDWGLTLFLGGIGMTIAGYLSTASIQNVTPGTFSFFQIFQPLFVVYAAHVFLKEKIDSLYFYWGIWIILSAFFMYSQDLLIMFDHPDTVSIPHIMIALGTMLIWGLATIAAKKLVSTQRVFSLVAGRWIFAFIFSSGMLFLEEKPLDLNILLNWDFNWRLLFMSGVAGVISMYLYYEGMRAIPAGRVSFLELSYPALGMIFSSLYTFESMTFIQVIGAASFFAFIMIIVSRKSHQNLMPAEVTPKAGSLSRL